ncbi:ABC transporter permease [Aeromicrobium sp.]|uniref:ABC transporter permease n=1 Tax=Aeromicrobium sp. TaxID=1871063 RepID=UPI0028A6C4F7|nr:ABC transporter permease [Aeromicrobium sp.]
MTRLFLRRLRVVIPTLLLITLLSFMLRVIIPGGPAEALLGGSDNPDTIKMINERYGLDRPVWEQYFSWIGGVLRGDFGISYATGLPVVDVLGPRMASTLEIVGLGMLVALLVGGAVGMFAAIKRETRFGRFVFAISGLGVSVPVFWISTMCVGIFGASLGWLPVNGYTPWSAGVGPHLESILMPVLLIAVPPTAFTIRHVRSAMVAALDSPYIRAARAMGVSSARINFDLALRNAVGPVITFIPFLASTLVGELVIIDVVFVLPGLGASIIDAVHFRDFAALQAIVLLLAFAVVMLSLIADLVLTAIDPRRRKELA